MYNELQTCYVSVAIPEQGAVEHLHNCSFGATLKYTLKDCDPVTHEPDSDEGYSDEYTVCFKKSSCLGTHRSGTHEQ